MATEILQNVLHRNIIIFTYVTFPFSLILQLEMCTRIVISALSANVSSVCHGHGHGWWYLEIMSNNCDKENRVSAKCNIYLGLSVFNHHTSSSQYNRRLWHTFSIILNFADILIEEYIFRLWGQINSCFVTVSRGTRPFFRNTLRNIFCFKTCDKKMTNHIFPHTFWKNPVSPT